MQLNRFVRKIIVFLILTQTVTASSEVLEDAKNSFFDTSSEEEVGPEVEELDVQGPGAGFHWSMASDFEYSDNVDGLKYFPNDTDLEKSNFENATGTWGFLHHPRSSLSVYINNIVHHALPKFSEFSVKCYLHRNMTMQLFLDRKSFANYSLANMTEGDTWNTISVSYPEGFHRMALTFNGSEHDKDFAIIDRIVLTKSPPESTSSPSEATYPSESSTTAETTTSDEGTTPSGGTSASTNGTSASTNETSFSTDGTISSSSTNRATGTPARPTETTPSASSAFNSSTYLIYLFVALVCII